MNFEYWNSQCIKNGHVLESINDVEQTITFKCHCSDFSHVILQDVYDIKTTASDVICEVCKILKKPDKTLETLTVDCTTDDNENKKAMFNKTKMEMIKQKLHKSFVVTGNVITYPLTISNGCEEDNSVVNLIETFSKISKFTVSNMSDIATNKTSKINLVCENGHQITKSVTSFLKNQGRYECQTCYKTKRKSVEEQRQTQDDVPDNDIPTPKKQKTVVSVLRTPHRVVPHSFTMTTRSTSWWFNRVKANWKSFMSSTYKMIILENNQDESNEGKLFMISEILSIGVHSDNINISNDVVSFNGVKHVFRHEFEFLDETSISPDIDFYWVYNVVSNDIDILKLDEVKKLYQ